jgi:hypothetical protein
VPVATAMALRDRIDPGQRRPQADVGPDPISHLVVACLAKGRHIRCGPCLCGAQIHDVRVTAQVADHHRPRSRLGPAEHLPESGEQRLGEATGHPWVGAEVGPVTAHARRLSDERPVAGAELLGPLVRPIAEVVVDAPVQRLTAGSEQLPPLGAVRRCRCTVHALCSQHRQQRVFR